MQGYAIKLSYELDNELLSDHEPFKLIAQTGDYRYGMRRFNQPRAGRTATDEDWNKLMSDLYFEDMNFQRLVYLIINKISLILLCICVLLYFIKSSTIIALFKLNKKIIFDENIVNKKYEIFNKIFIPIFAFVFFTNWFSRIWYPGLYLMAFVIVINIFICVKEYFILMNDIK